MRFVRFITALLAQVCSYLNVGRRFKMKPHLIFLWVIIFTSCAEKRNDNIQYQDGNQILNANNINRYGELIEPAYLRTTAPDTVEPGQKTYAKVFLSNPHFRIVNAIFDCNVSNTSLVDTTTNRIIGCSKGLMLENDTVRIHFTAGEKPGSKKFEEIVILSKDNENVYRYHSGTFNYFVNK